MEKKKIAGMAVGLSLAAIVGTGATLAYLSDDTGTLTNTFAFTDKGIQITLDEAKIDEKNMAVADGERVAAGEVQDYKDIQPNTLMDKDPTVTVAKNSVRTNVFVSVKNENDEEVLKIVDLDSKNWVKVKPDTYDMVGDVATTYYVYAGERANPSTEKGDSFLVVETSEDDTVLEDVFTQVQAGWGLEGKTDMNPIVIRAAAVQADSVTDAVAAENALTKLGCTNK